MISNGVRLATAQTRNSGRKCVLMKAMIIDQNGAHHAIIKNMSATGAQLSSPKAPPLGSDVLFRRGAIVAAARVVWASDQAYGIEFYRALDAANLTPAAVVGN